MNQTPDLSEEMYRRTYRLIKRGLDVRVIAATLHVPLKSIQNVIDRLNTIQLTELEKPSSTEGIHHSDGKFLDIYFYTKTRYSLLHLVGMVLEQTKDIIEMELEKAYNTSWKAIAIRMSDVTLIDTTGVNAILSFLERMKTHERFSAILDPSPTIEPQIAPHEAAGKIAVFGTERAFEEKAFEPKKNATIRRK